MKYNPEIYHRKSIRLKGYDYSSNGAYFITICVKDRVSIFGEIVNGKMNLNGYGKIVLEEWLKTEEIRENVIMDEFIIMPNHFHGIIFIEDSGRGDPVGSPIFSDNEKRASHRLAPTESKTLKPNSLGAILGQFKSISTKKINKLNQIYFQWQRNYYEHIIRNEKALNNIRKYIIENPLKWQLDRENPSGHYDKYQFKNIQDINNFQINENK